MSWVVATAGAALTGLVSGVGWRWWTRHRLEAALMPELERMDEAPLRIPDRSNPRLAELARETRSLRLELQSRQLWLVHGMPLASETPWARRQRCDDYDTVLCELRRAIWDWLRMFQQLGIEERLVLGEFGVSAVPFRSLLFSCDRTNDVWEQLVYMRAPDLDLVWAEIRRTILELERFEVALLSGCSLTVYR
jgi:hypothetical protein